MSKPINYLAQTGALEDLIGSIQQDAETEVHYDRLKISLERDLKFEEDAQMQDELVAHLEELEEFKNDVRKARYTKTNIALSIAQGIAENKSDSRYSCAFKHQLQGMAEMRDAMGAIDNKELANVLESVYFDTVNNAANTISKFLGLPVESCMACLFEKNKIETSSNL